MNEVIPMAVWFEYTDDKTPSSPTSDRGSFSPTILVETEAQNKAGLVWIRCPFCGGYVLVLALPDYKSRIREKCRCGAKRLCRNIRRGHEVIGYVDGWRKNDVEWTQC